MRIQPLLRTAQLVSLNAVPALGVFRADWPISTALALYWCENVLLTLLIALRIVLHRRLTQKQGHFNVDETITTTTNGRRRTVHRQGSFLSGFLLIAIPFTLAHGLFLLFILVILPNGVGPTGRLDIASLRDGLVAISALLVARFVIDLWGLHHRPFAWIQGLAGIYYARMVIVHLTIIFGMAALTFFGRGLFGVFVTLKTLFELSMLFLQYEPAEPPSWLAQFLNWIRPNNDFVEYWHKERADRLSREAEDEVVGSTSGMKTR